MRGMRGPTCEISYEGKVRYLHGSPAKLEYNYEKWVIQHLLVCTHSKKEIMILFKLDVVLHFTHSCTVGINMKGNVANTQRDPKRWRLFRFPYLL